MGYFTKIKLRLRVFYSFFRLIKDPGQGKYIFDIADSMCALGTVTPARLRLEADPNARRVIQERTLLKNVDFDELLKLPTGSLGHTFASHMRTLGLTLEFFRDIDIKDADTYMAMRLRQTHDLWHVVTGFKTDIPGEVSLLALMYAYAGLPFPAFLLGGGLVVAAVTSGEEVQMRSQAMAAGMTLGAQVKGLFAYDWEANWQKPVVQVQRELNIDPAIYPAPIPGAGTSQISATATIN